MNSKTSKYKSIISQINYLSLLLFVFWLPLKDDYLPAVMAGWIGTWLLEGNLKERFTQISCRYLFWGLAAYFAFNVIFFFRTNDFNDGVFEIQQKLSVVFFPIILAGSNNSLKNNSLLVLKVFVIGVIIASVYCLLYALNSNLYYENGQFILKYTYDDVDWLKNKSFIETILVRTSFFGYSILSIFKHHAYFSMYIVFSILIIINFFRKKLIKTITAKILYILAVIFLSGMLFLLQSRSAFVTIPIVIACMAVVEFRKNINLISIGIFVMIVVGAIFAISTSSRLQQNIKDIKNIKEEGFVSHIKERDIRYRLWYTSILVIKDNFWIGTAPANEEAALTKKYKELGFEHAEKEHLNSHNQYLQTFVGSGVFGFLALMFVIVYSFIISIRKKHYLLFFLMLILSINFLFESMLNRMAGVLFMMFFLSMFTFMEAKIEQDNA